MGRYSVKRYKTKRYTRDMDQILHEDMKDQKSISKLQNQDFDEYRPGLAQFYCIPCAHYYESEHALKTHQRTKVHKRRLKALKNPYTKEEADFAAGKDVAKYFKLLEKQQVQHENPAVQELMKIKNDLESVPAEMDVEETEDIEANEEPAIDV